MSTSSRKSIGIIGAGISGLTAGLELQRDGYAVSIYEARARSGGRIHSVLIDGMVVETGPEFIHGHLKETLGLLKKYQIRYEAIHGRTYQAHNGRFEEMDGMAEGWELLLDRMKSLSADVTLLDFLNIYFPASDFAELRASTIRYAEGFDLADPHFASTRSLHTEWQEEESAEQYRIPAGYTELIHAMEKDFLQEGGQIFFSHPVKTLDWNQQDIRLLTGSDLSWSHDQIIVTLPVSLLNEANPGGFRFVLNPPSEQTQKAFEQIGFGTVIKIVLIWKRPFWKTIIPEAQFIFTPGFVPTWWTQHPMDLPMLTGWLGGPNANATAGQPDDLILEKALENLAENFSIPLIDLKKELRSHRVFNWKYEPWTMGGYSYSGIESAAARLVCRRPLGGRIYFSGEALYEGPYPGTVEAAIISGLNTARDLA